MPRRKKQTDKDHDDRDGVLKKEEDQPEDNTNLALNPDSEGEEGGVDPQFDEEDLDDQDDDDQAKENEAIEEDDEDEEQDDEDPATEELDEHDPMYDDEVREMFVDDEPGEFSAENLLEEFEQDWPSDLN